MKNINKYEYFKFSIKLLLGYNSYIFILYWEIIKISNLKIEYLFFEKNGIYEFIYEYD